MIRIQSPPFSFPFNQVSVRARHRSPCHSRLLLFRRIFCITHGDAQCSCFRSLLFVCRHHRPHVPPTGKLKFFIFTAGVAADTSPITHIVSSVVHLFKGVAGMIACPIAGQLSDYMAIKHPDVLESRLWYSTVIALAVTPTSLLLFGWSLHYEMHISVVMFAQFFVGAGISFYLPGLFA